MVLAIDELSEFESMISITKKSSIVMSRRSLEKELVLVLLFSWVFACFEKVTFRRPARLGLGVFGLLPTPFGASIVLPL